ncbi:hypothetical protein [Luteolibacter soli]|uniref:Nucleotide-diphospho-sugar transferase domain-containing protein n=1 Tax=Luteolibacter soli TaxID=3135280 RepID=A0ABU9ASX3_9BACT
MEEEANGCLSSLPRRSTTRAMELATTLVHKGAMDIGVHAVRTFAKHFRGNYRLEIHTDGSPDATDEVTLLHAANGLEARIIRPSDRRPLLDERLADFPRTRALMDGIGYFAKMELPMAAMGPYLYFDSDIVWLRPVTNLKPPKAPNAFSTESWSWYNGVANDHLWTAAKTPRRVNSGFYYLGEPFPFQRMEEMLERGMFDPTIRYNTDQEIMAYLFCSMNLYHPDDLKRSRVRKTYDLGTLASAALHFPGQMWRSHMDQIEALESAPPKSAVAIRYQDPVPLTELELFRMRMNVRLSDSPTLGRLINRLRAIRQKFA